MLLAKLRGGFNCQQRPEGLAHCYYPSVQLSMDGNQLGELSAGSSGANGPDAPAARPERATTVAATSLYVGNLHPAVDEGMLLDVFSTIGPVEEVKVCNFAESDKPADASFTSLGQCNRQSHTSSYTKIIIISPPPRFSYAGIIMKY